MTLQQRDLMLAAPCVVIPFKLTFLIKSLWHGREKQGKSHCLFTKINIFISYSTMSCRKVVYVLSFHLLLLTVYYDMHG